MAESFVNIKMFTGIDNISDKFSLNPAKGTIKLRLLDNVDIDDRGKPHRRDGYRDLIVPSTKISNFWSDGKVALFQDGTTFRMLNTDYSYTDLILNVDPTDLMAYVSVAGTIYFSNKSIVGYFKSGKTFPFPIPTETYKIRMVGGQVLEYYNNRLLSGNMANLFFSDATRLMQMDKRKNAIALPDYITMVKAVMDGVYVGTREKGVFFYHGQSPTNWVERQPTNVGVIEGTGVVLEEDNIGKGILEKVAYWVGANGAVYKGLPGGIVIRCQNELFKMDNLARGVGIIKMNHGYKQYVSICVLKAGVGAMSGKFVVPRFQFTGKE